jgi:hypothetical protein
VCVFFSTTRYDGGGPAVVQNPNGSWKQAGIVSFGFGRLFITSTVKCSRDFSPLHSSLHKLGSISFFKNINIRIFYSLRRLCRSRISWRLLQCGFFQELDWHLHEKLKRHALWYQLIRHGYVLRYMYYGRSFWNPD